MNTQDIVKALGVKTYVVSVMPSFLQGDSSYVVDVPTDHALVDPSKPVQISAYKSAGQSEEKVFYAFIQDFVSGHISAPAVTPNPVDVSSVDHKDVV